jgi:hypothetical protein
MRGTGEEGDNTGNRQTATEMGIIIFDKQKGSRQAVFLVGVKNMTDEAAWEKKVRRGFWGERNLSGECVSEAQHR